MAAQPVEWVLVVYYGPEAHRATYGRQVRSNKYTKDFIQLSRKQEFLEAVANLFSVAASATGVVPLTYQWPKGNTPGAFVFKSGDRPHLKWETALGAPRVWKMTLSPSDSTEETIPGDPSHLEFEDAEKEFALLASRGAGQPYLMAVKLRDEPRTLHLRAYLSSPSSDYSWANLALAPHDVQSLAAKTSQKSALAWSLFQSGGVAPTPAIDDVLSQLIAAGHPEQVIDVLDPDTGRALISYLQHPGHGLFFDPAQNHEAWVDAKPVSTQVTEVIDELLRRLEARFPVASQGDAAAEMLEADPEEFEAFREQIQQESYEVADSTATIKTRGSAQRAFAEAVKANYGYRCAITGVTSRDFLVASHIVPWSKDQAIRLDPSNGICLSLLVDRAFENGYLQIADNLTIHVDWGKVGDDDVLRAQLEPYDGKTLRAPTNAPPRPEYLQRRRALVATSS